MAVGGARDIRDVKPSSFDLLANSLGITSSYLRSIVAPIADNAEVAIREAGNESLGSSQKFLPLSGRRSAGRHRPAPSRLRGVLQSLAACILAGKLFSVRPISPLPERKPAVKSGFGCKSLNRSNVKSRVQSEFAMSSRSLSANVGMKCYESAISLTNPLTHSTASARFWVTSKPSADSAYRDAQFDPASIAGGHACCPLYANSRSHVSRV